MSRPDTPDSSDVVVVGAGLAGLMCATTLEKRGLVVDVIEAGDAVGGRVRTDVVDGFVMDRGFQLLNPTYPAVRRFVDVKALRLGTFRAGVAVAGPGGPKVVGDPFRAPELLAKTIRSGYLRPLELFRLGVWAAPAVGHVDRLSRRRDTDLFTSLDRAGVSGHLRSEILEPFLTGVLADSSGRTSANFTRLLIRSFLLGNPGVPAAGMGALPAQLAARLSRPVRLGVRATGVSGGSDGPVLDTDSGRLRPRVVVIATDPAGAGELLPIATPEMKGLRTYWYAADEAPTQLRLLMVDGDGRKAGPVVNTAVMSHAAPSYAPPGRHLVQATTLLPDPSGELEVRAHLQRMYGTSTSGWELVLRHDVPAALPHQSPPLVRRKDVDLGHGLFVAGDHRDTSSIQGALVSGRRAANAVSRYLRR